LRLAQTAVNRNGVARATTIRCSTHGVVMQKVLMQKDRSAFHTPGKTLDIVKNPNEQ